MNNSKINMMNQHLLGIGIEVLQLLAQNLRRELFPIHIAANKADIAIDGVLDLVDANGIVVACMADMELGLRRASSAGMIDYQIGSDEFSIVDDSNLSETTRCIKQNASKVVHGRIDWSCQSH